ncbi:hypothetical protein SADUNF_Sadunf06G0214400 [Salix dunnii]|uniref:R13L1/DRL21-like LRR repeat region domain-containing protein n=1 Tax=Salix dunnii TaxID=1413687 RepID=A0A835K8L0_9ROSI|nr:hypothetical protein SADUNF_Sadunf06G0214400 [Salix dunnii]
MVEGVFFGIAQEIIKKLGSLASQEVALWWGLKDQLLKLNDIVTRITAMIQEVEEKLMSGNGVSREVRVFFSRSNQFVYGLRMGHKVKTLRERLGDIEADNKIFNFEVCDEERASLTTVREKTTSSEPEVIVGREGDKVGKTTLAQNVFNDFDSCVSLEYMPHGIEKLTSLQTLSCFVVEKNRSPKSKMVGGLDELSRLNELRGNLEIRVEGPNLSLQELRVRGYGGMRFPSWLSSLSNLVRSHLNAYTRLEHIPPLDGIPSLEELWIMHMYNLEYIDSEGVGGKEVSKILSKSDFNVVVSMPLQQTMKMKPLVYSSSFSSSFIRPLSNLKDLRIWSIDDIESLPEVGLQNLSSLQQLDIRNCSRLKSLPLHSQGMPSLQHLLIYGCHGCPRLKLVSESKSQGMMPYLPSLHELDIIDCSEELSRGWGKKSEETLPNIKHIPNIIINRYYIQKEGRYVEGQ